MRTIWTLTYQTLPGNGEQTQVYKSAASLQKKLREIISNIDIDAFIKLIENELQPTNFADAEKFLRHYVADGIASDEILPTIDKSVITNSQPDDDEFEFDISPNKITIGCYDSECYLSDDIIKVDCASTFAEKFFYFILPGQFSENKFHDVYLKLTAEEEEDCPEYTPSSYPILILQALKQQLGVPKKPTALSKEIYKQFGVSIDRSSISRNISLLQAIGYDIVEDKKRYNLISGTPALPASPASGKKGAYPILILIALENAQPDGINEKDIADFIWHRYSTKLDKRTLKTHIEALRKVGFNIKSEKGKHTLI